MTYIISAAQFDYDLEVWGETLSEVRKKLVDEALDQGINMDCWLDQVHAVSLLDESELDEEEVAEINDPRPLNSDTLRDLAIHVWDVPDVKYEVTEAPVSITRGELKASQHLLGLDNAGMAHALNVAPRTYARWIAGAMRIPMGICEDVHALFARMDKDAAELSRLHDQETIVVYPGTESEQQLDGRSLGWEQRACELAMRTHGVPVYLGGEV
ncbi:hypothetical protein [Corynebacterium sp. HMSC04H06]|uniref:hypothetical protein n=1 Tax=Corynebacterium sp. HMSC04H06 TaxID=1581050 RepID=UPI0008A1FD9D|nr:hypothetical protein [Corynebacterium sp. HMSC04H06]OFS19221.1 hypothetical protein HMPREF3067_09950 [Corynebacterium sp. HMSC04H06]